MPDMSANRLPIRATIVIPTRDRPGLLGRAVAGALAQTVPDLQVLVIDDGSGRVPWSGGNEGVVVMLSDVRELVARS
jgi:cellulose synthase/poly-beta-1,6-N-acetylglucosamine synthase-like glycosyltransferase